MAARDEIKHYVERTLSRLGIDEIDEGMKAVVTDSIWAEWRRRLERYLDEGSEQRHDVPLERSPGVEAVRDVQVNEKPKGTHLRPIKSFIMELLDGREHIPPDEFQAASKAAGYRWESVRRIANSMPQVGKTDGGDWTLVGTSAEGVSRRSSEESGTVSQQ